LGIKPKERDDGLFEMAMQMSARQAGQRQVRNPLASAATGAETPAAAA